MNILEINNEMKIDCFKGTFSCDAIPKIKYKQPIAIIINTDPSYKPGEHWVALFINNNIAEYFDSFGGKPIKEIYIFYILIMLITYYIVKQYYKVY